MWTGICSSSAASQNGSSSAESSGSPDGKAEMITPRYPAALASRSHLTDVGMSTPGICASPMSRSGSAAMNSSCIQVL